MASLVSLNSAVTSNIVAAQDGKLNENDFIIKDFGFKDGKPWLIVEGKLEHLNHKMQVKYMHTPL